MNVPAYDDVSSPSISLEFSRVVGSLYSDGFLEDLGTGLANNQLIPCEATNLTPKPPTTPLQCRLLYGVNPFATRIIITNFDAIAATTNVQIHIPKIFNPVGNYQWV